MTALRSLADFRDSTLVPQILPLLADPVPNVQVQAAIAAGGLGGRAAVPALARLLEGKGPLAVRREALLALARLDSTRFAGAAAKLQTSADWRERAAAAEGAGIAGSGHQPLVPVRPGRARDRGRLTGLGRRGKDTRRHARSPPRGRCCSTPMPRCEASPPMSWPAPPSPRI